ncbi:MAG: acyl-CoA dehydrogenase family protein [Saprospiraceae bacterium]
MHEAGLIGMSLPRKYNGLNVPLVPYVMAEEMVSRADASLQIFGDCRIVLRQSENLQMRNKR